MLFINGETLFKRGRNQNTLEPEHAAVLLEAVRVFRATPRPCCASSTLDEIAANDFNLNIPLYVDPADTGDGSSRGASAR